MTQYMKYSLLIVVMLISVSVNGQDGHSHDHPKGHSKTSFVEMMLSLQIQLDALTRAVIIDDFEAAHAAAHGIATHAGPSSEELQQLMEILADKSKDFKACDKEVHHFAMETARSAQSNEGDAMVDMYIKLVKQIRLCHLEFRKFVKKNK